MISYTSSFISEYYQSLESKTLDTQFLECINSILDTINNDISLNNIDNDNDIRFKKTKLKSAIFILIMNFMRVMSWI